ncbi:hypothetical protein RHGRI_016126 [Rhododendron griersonianum]|uniref:Cyclic nucleotide-binding domain-containing protein n=1 Tax=Rhododendron griersonianum TaxID=479676 RepID=A0AAV6JSX2_9ERIC|nr:hypothetical protein RHGRI_016126 [Rhododendron griersonianum]
MKILPKYGTKIVFWWCVLAIFFDYLVFYIPVIDDDKKCLGLDENLQTAAIVWRTIFDVFYIIHMIFQFRTRFNVPSASEIALRYSCWDFLMDVLAVLPLPQVFFLSIIPRMGGSRSWNTHFFLRDVFLYQFAARLYRVLRVLPSRKRRSRTSGVFIEAAWDGWDGAAYSLIIYMYFSHDPRTGKTLGIGRKVGRLYELINLHIPSHSIAPPTHSVSQSKCSVTSNSSNSLGFSELSSTVYPEASILSDDPTSAPPGSTPTPSGSSLPEPSHFGFAPNEPFTLPSSPPTELPAPPLSDDSPLRRSTRTFMKDDRAKSVGKTIHFFWVSCLLNYIVYSSLGQNLKTSTNSDEILFAMGVFMFGVMFFSFFIAEIQKHMQQENKIMGLEEWRVKMREVEQWMSARSLPASLRERIKQYEQYKWQKTRGVDEENLISNLPKDLRKDIKRHLGLDRLKRVPVFQRMDEQLLDALCGRLEQFLYTEGSFIIWEGKPVDAMLFVMDGKLASSTTNGGSIGFFNIEYLERGDFGGEELLGWALDPHSSTKLPFSTRTVKALSEVEALVLKADDLKIVASEFRWSHNKQLRHFFRFYSQQWRTWAACFIQAAWQQYRQNKLEGSLRIKEANRLQDASARGGGSLPSLGAITYVVRFAVNAIRAVRRNGSALTPRLPERIFPTMIQKPAEPDFIAEGYNLQNLFDDTDEETAAESDSTEFRVAFEEGSKGKYAASSSEVPGLPVQARSHQKRSCAEDERYDKLSTQLEEVGLATKTKLEEVDLATKTKLEEVGSAIKKLTDDRLNVNDLYEEVMKTEGFDELTLALAFDHLVENEKVAKAFMVKNARLRRAWLEGFLKTNA